MKPFIVLAIAVALLTSCAASGRYVAPQGMTEEQSKNAEAGCLFAALAIFPTLYFTCMELRAFTWIEAPQTPASPVPTSSPSQNTVLDSSR